MKRKYAIIGLVLALSIMATTIVYAEDLDITKDGKYSIWSAPYVGASYTIQEVYYEYTVWDNHGNPVPVPGGGFVIHVDLPSTEYEVVPDDDYVILVFKIKELNKSLDESWEDKPNNYKIDFTATTIKYTDDGVPKTATGPMWRIGRGR